MDVGSREDQLRLAAHALGLRLEKSSDPRDFSVGGYMVVYRERNAVAYGAAGHRGRGYGLTLDEVEAYLKRCEKRERKRGVARRHGPIFPAP